MDGQVDQAQVRPAALEPVDRLMAAVRGAVVDDPEHPLGGGVGLSHHHLVDEPVERFDAAPSLRAADQLGALDVPGAEIGERAAALVGVLDPLACPGAEGRLG